MPEGPRIFSTRTDWDPAPNRLTRLLTRLRAAGVRPNDLTESNPTRCGFGFPDREILGALANPVSMTYDPDPKGLKVAREAVADDYRGRGTAIGAERILLTASSSEAYSFLFRLLAAPGESVLVPAPCYPLFELLARINDVVLRPYALDGSHRFSIDTAEIARAVAECRPRAVLVVSPGNPTGRYLKRDELASLSRICADANVPIISDEVFGDYALVEETDRVATMIGSGPALTFTLNGLSKMLALPQMKLGWIAASGPDTQVAAALARLEVITDTFLSVNTPVQHALGALLALRPRIQAPILERLAINKRRIDQAMGTDGPCRCLPIEGGWSAILQVPRTRSDEEWALLLLEEEQVVTHPGYFFDFPSEGHLVISLLPEPDRFASGIDRIVKRVTREA